MRTPYLLLGLVSLSMADWTTDGTDSQYSRDLYLVGLGTSAVSAEDAQTTAIAKVQEQFGGRLRSTTTTERSSQRNDKGEVIRNASTSESSFRVSDQVEGIRVVKQSKVGERFAALAVLDRSAYSHILKARILGADSLCQQSLASMHTAMQAGDVPLAVAQLKSCEEAQKQSEVAISRWSVVSSFPVPKVKAGGGVDSASTALASGLKLKVLSGAQQTIELGKSFQSIDLELKLGKQVAKDVEIAIFEGNKQVGGGRTNSEGRLSWQPSNPSQIGSYQWRVEPILTLPGAGQALVSNRGLDVSGIVAASKQGCKVKLVLKPEQFRAPIEKALRASGFTPSASASAHLELEWKAKQLDAMAGLGSSSVQKLALEVDIRAKGPGGEDELHVQREGIDATGQGAQKLLSTLDFGAELQRLRQILCEP